MIELKSCLRAAGLDFSKIKTRVWVEKLAQDSRLLDEKTWFLALRGQGGRHGLDFYKGEACAGILYEPPYDSPPQGAIAVQGLTERLGFLASCFYAHPSAKLPAIGVTGTDGKSSLVHFLAQVLGASMLGTIGNGTLDCLQKSTHTTPDALMVHGFLQDFYHKGASCVAMEVSSHALAQGRVDGVLFDTAVFSNLSRDHLDYHQDMEDYFLAKAQLFKRQINHAVINIDDVYGRRLLEEGFVFPKAEVWAVSSKGNVPPKGLNNKVHLLRAENICLHAFGLSFDLYFDGALFPIQAPLLARFNVDNLLNVIACALGAGLDMASVIARLKVLKGVPGRVERFDLGEDRAAIVDYAHTAQALECALLGIRAHVKGRLWVVFGCGGERDVGKRALMARAAECCADQVVVTDDNPRREDPEAIIAMIMQGFQKTDQVVVKRGRAEAIFYVLNQLQAGDAVLIAGKGHEDYQIIGDKRYAYSDQAVIAKWLGKNG